MAFDRRYARQLRDEAYAVLPALALQHATNDDGLALTYMHDAEASPMLSLAGHFHTRATQPVISMMMKFVRRYPDGGMKPLIIASDRRPPIKRASC